MHSFAEVNGLTTSLSFPEGAEARCDDRSLLVREALGPDAVLVEGPQPGKIQRLGADLPLIASAESADSSPTNLNAISDSDWAEARRRRDLIAPLLDGTRCPRSLIMERARAGGCGTTTLYRWARLYRASGLLSSLLPEKSDGGRGKTRLNPAVEQILAQTIKEHYLSTQQRTVRSTAQEVARRCRGASLLAPNPDTVRLRILAVPMRDRLRRRSHRKEAADRFAPRPGTFDGAAAVGHRSDRSHQTRHHCGRSGATLADRAAVDHAGDRRL